MSSSRINPFRVSCPGCAGKLVIRSENLLGRTVACPRCKHAVAIPTAGQLQVSADQQIEPAIDSQALTAVDLDASSQDSAAVSRSTAGGLAAFELPGNFEHLASNFDAEDFSRLGENDHASDQPPLQLPASDDWSPATDAAWPYGAQTAPPSSGIRRLVIAAACVSLLSLIALGLFLKSVRREPVGQLAGGVADAVLAAEPADAGQPPQKAAALTGEPTDTNPLTETPDTPAAAKPPAAVGTAQTPDASAAGDGSTMPSVDPTVAAPGDSTDPSLVITQPPGTAQATDTAQPLATAQPPDMLMEFLRGSSPELRMEGGAKPTGAPPAPVERDIPDAMRQFAPIFDLGSAAALPDAPRLAPGATPGEEAHRSKVNLGSLYHPDPAPWPEWASLRNRSIPRVTVPGRPLLPTLYTLEAAFGIPLAWDLDAIRFIDVDLRQRVELDVQTATIEQIYRQCIAASKLRLQPPAGSPLARIIPEDATDAATMLREIDISRWQVGQSGAVGVQADAAAWSAMFRGLLPNEAAQWVIEGTRIVLPDSLTLSDRRVLADALEQLDEILTAEADVQTTSAIDRYAAAATALQRTGSGYTALRRPVALVLQQAAAESELDLIVDWQACWSHGLTPMSPMAALTAGRTFGQVSRFVLDEFSLIVVVDPRGRLIMTDTVTQRRLPRILLLPLTEGRTAADLRSQLSQLSPMSEDQRSTLEVLPLPGSTTWCAAYICPPTPQQLEDSRIRRALRLDR